MYNIYRHGYLDWKIFTRLSSYIVIMLISRALVAGGPVMAFEGLSLCGVHRKGITQSFARYGFNCVENIRRSWKTLENFASTSKQSLLHLATASPQIFSAIICYHYVKNLHRTISVFFSIYPCH